MIGMETHHAGQAALNCTKILLPLHLKVGLKVCTTLPSYLYFLDDIFLAKLFKG